MPPGPAPMMITSYFMVFILSEFNKKTERCGTSHSRPASDILALL
jgi:hypothetical protein